MKKILHTLVTCNVNLILHQRYHFPPNFSPHLCCLSSHPFFLCDGSALFEGRLCLRAKLVDKLFVKIKTLVLLQTQEGEAFLRKMTS